VPITVATTLELLCKVVVNQPTQITTPQSPESSRRNKTAFYSNNGPILYHLRYTEIYCPLQQLLTWPRRLLWSISNNWATVGYCGQSSQQRYTIQE